MLPPWASTTPVIDSHQHLWDRRRFRLDWIKPSGPLDRSFLLDDYRQATAGIRIVKTVYLEVDLDPAQQSAEADYVIGLCKDRATRVVAGVVSGRPALDGFRDYALPFRDSPFIKGVRQLLHVDSTPPGYCLAPEFIGGVRLLGELGLSFDLCLRPEELLDGAKLIDACPGTRFILDHCGNARVRADARERAQWRRDVAEVAKRPNVAGKVSGIVVSAEPGKWSADDLAPFVRHMAESFGVDRIMFGGDWPVCTQVAPYADWFGALADIVAEWPEPDRRKLFHDNAIKYYRLS